MSILNLNKKIVIRQIPLFSNLTKEQIDIVDEHSQLKEFKKNSIIYNEGDAPDAFYCLVTGRIKIYTAGLSGRENILEYLHRGQYFGIISLLTGDNHSVSAQALNESILLVITKDDFNLIIKNIPELALDLSQTLSRRLKRKDIHQKSVFESTIISVYSAYPGIGKTTYAINLSLGLSLHTKKKIILVDLNTKTHRVTERLGINQDKTIELAKISINFEAIKSHITNTAYGIDLISISYEPSDYKKITAILSLLTNDYHYLIIDLPSGMNEAIFEILGQSDEIHIVSRSLGLELGVTSQLILDLEEKLKYKSEKIRVIINEQSITPSVPHQERIELLKHSIFATLPRIDVLKHDTVILDNPSSEYARVIRRISRQLSGMQVGLALGSGAAFGLAHIGVLKVFEEENIPIDIITGSSIGAAVASFWVTGYKASEIEEIMSKEFSGKKFFNRLIDLTFPTTGFVKGYKLANLLKKYLGKKTFYDIRLPLKILAYDVKNKESVIIDEGPLVDAIMASSAMPGIFKPIEFKNELLLDGGVLSPLPTEALVKLGLKKIIAVNVIPSREDILEWRRDKIKHELEFNPKKFKNMFKTNFLDLVFSSIEIMQYEIVKKSAQEADLVIHPDVKDLFWLEFNKVKEFRERGEIEARKNINKIKDLIKET